MTVLNYLAFSLVFVIVVMFSVLVLAPTGVSAAPI